MNDAGCKAKASAKHPVRRVSVRLIPYETRPLGQAARSRESPCKRTTGAESPPVARAPNYGFEKRKKEQDRKAKKDAKREDRRLRKQERAQEGGTDEGTAESPEGDESPASDAPTA